MSMSQGPWEHSDFPKPTEIDCITVEKVYDSCIQTITTTQMLGDDVWCKECAVTSCTFDLDSSLCTVGTMTPSTTTDYSDITFVIGAEYTVSCSNGKSMTSTAYTTATVTLYNPMGTTPSCTIISGTCSCVNLPNDTISCTITLCVLFQTTAVVQIMVPTYGFCTPPTCGQVGPVLPCPPSSLFPPQSGASAI